MDISGERTGVIQRLSVAFSKVFEILMDNAESRVGKRSSIYSAFALGEVITDGVVFRKF